MTDAIKLNIEAEFPGVPRRHIGRLIAIGPGEAIGFVANEGHCRFTHFSNGDVTSSTCRFDAELLMDGVMKKVPPVLLQSGGHWLLYVNDSTLHVLGENFQPATEIRIEGELPPHPGFAATDKCPFPDAVPGLSDANMLPLLMPGSWSAPRAIRHLSVLNIDLNAGTACWDTLASQQLFSLDPNQFPETHLGDEPPVIDHVLYRDGRLYVFVLGNSSNYSKWGMAYFGLVTVDVDLNVEDNLLLEVDPGNDEKRRGRHGVFSSSRTYCIITPDFPKTDPWKKKQHLFNLDTRTLHEVKLPRGFSKYRLLDHAGDTFWIECHDEDPYESLVVSCTAS